VPIKVSMSLGLLVLLFVYIAFAREREVRPSDLYRNFQVIKVSYNSTFEYDEIINCCTRDTVDIWSVNPREKWFDLMIPTSRLSYWQSQFPVVSVKYPDVQDLVDKSLRENYAAMKSKGSVGFEFDFFPTYGQIRAYLSRQIAAHPDIASEITLGKSYNDEDIVGISIGDPSLPIFYMHCGIHAREWISPTTCLYIIDQLLNVDPDRERLIQTYNWMIIPVQNVDGYAHTHTTSRLWRKNRQPNVGSSCIGTDINRNYPYAWGGVGADPNPCGETFRGARAVSSPEAKAEVDFLAPYLNAGQVAAYLDIHSYGGWFLSPWGYTNQDPPDYDEMDKMMQAAVAAIRSVNGRSYIYGPSGSTLYPTSGGTNDEMYGNGGIIHSYVIECYGNNFTPPPSWILPIGKEVWAGVKKISDLL